MAQSASEIRGTPAYDLVLRETFRRNYQNILEEELKKLAAEEKAKQKKSATSIRGVPAEQVEGFKIKGAQESFVDEGRKASVAAREKFKAAEAASAGKVRGASFIMNPPTKLEIAQTKHAGRSLFQVQKETRAADRLAEATKIVKPMSSVVTPKTKAAPQFGRLRGFINKRSLGGLGGAAVLGAISAVEGAVEEMNAGRSVKDVFTKLSPTNPLIGAGTGYAVGSALSAIPYVGRAIPALGTPLAIASTAKKVGEAVSEAIKAKEALEETDIQARALTKRGIKVKRKGLLRGLLTGEPGYRIEE